MKHNIIINNLMLKRIVQQKSKLRAKFIIFQK